MNTFACSLASRSPTCPFYSNINASAASSSGLPIPARSDILRPLPAGAPAGPRLRPRRRNSSGVVPRAASKRGGDAYGAGPGGWLVDEDMIVLRKRLHEMRAAEANYQPPSHWMEWEKRYYAANYGDDVCRLVGLLQAFLVNSRPGAAVGLVALLALSVSTSAAVVVLKLAEVLAGLLLG